MTTTASPVICVQAADDGASEAVRPRVLDRVAARGCGACEVAAGCLHVPSVLPSSTTTISCGIASEPQLDVEVLDASTRCSLPRRAPG